MPELTFPLRSFDINKCSPIGYLNDYSILQPLGDGHLFPVFVAIDPADKQLVVIKIMDPSENSFINEASIFKFTTHDKIVRCKKLVENGKFSLKESYLSRKDKIKLTFSTTTSESLYLTKNALVLELAPYGDLFNYVAHGPFSEPITRFYMEQLLDAIEHLHSNGYCHSDIKLENILLDDKFKIKLTDFGFSCNIFDGKVIEKKAGTPSYRPPEMWVEEYKGHNGIKTDIFQLGIVLFILQTGMRPFHEANKSDLYYKTALAGRWDLFWMLKQKDFNAKKLAGLTDELKDLLMKMLSPKLEDRPSLEQIKESLWFTKTRPATEEEVLAEMRKRVDLMA